MASMPRICGFSVLQELLSGRCLPKRNTTISGGGTKYTLTVWLVSESLLEFLRSLFQMEVGGVRAESKH